MSPDLEVILLFDEWYIPSFSYSTNTLVSHTSWSWRYFYSMDVICSVSRLSLKNHIFLMCFSLCCSFFWLAWTDMPTDALWRGSLHVLHELTSILVCTILSASISLFAKKKVPVYHWDDWIYTVLTCRSARINQFIVAYGFSHGSSFHAYKK